MASCTALRWRIALVAAVGLPLCVIGLSLAQPPRFPPGGNPVPPQNQPRPPGGPIGPNAPRGPGNNAPPQRPQQRCSVCGMALPNQANQALCPFCGARFNNQPGVQAAAPEAQSDSAGSASGSTSNPAGPSRASMWVLLVFVGGGLLLLLALAGIGGLVWMISTAPSRKGRRSRA